MAGDRNSLLVFIYSCTFNSLLSISADRKDYSPTASYPFCCSCNNGNAGGLVCSSYNKREVPVSCSALHSFRKVTASLIKYYAKSIILS